MGARSGGAGTLRLARAPRSLLVALIAAAGVVLLGAVFFGLWFASSAQQGKAGEFQFAVPYASPGWPAVASTAETSQHYDTIAVSSHEPLVLPRALAGIATALPFLIVIVGCIGLITLAVRMLGGKPFSRAAQAILAVLGALAAASAVLVPWLEARLVEIAVAELGMPTDGTLVTDSDTDAWVSPPHFDPLQDLHWPLFALGAILLLIAMLWNRAARLQRETEGLV